MPKPIDGTPFAPQRKEEKLDDGTWKVTVTPPSFLGLSGKSVELTENQYHRYRRWRIGGELIQDVLPELSTLEREILINGNPDL